MSVKLWGHSCMLSRSVLCGSPFLVLMALYKARASGRSVPPLQGTAFISHHATARMACPLCVFLTWQSVIDYDITATRIQILQERSLIAKVVRSLPLKSYIYCWASDVFLVHNFGHKPCIWWMPISAHLGHKWLHEEVILWCLPLGFVDSQQCQKFSKYPIENHNHMCLDTIDIIIKLSGISFL